ncbi:NAD(P)-dependent oxidoreductase [Aerococcus loyolae]|uniref:NAD(P)-binding domain-containing protein n=1 Tax=Aerococcus loyolae TaxID=2976809 RepID=A0ABT4C149_9LACT|nr:NAD(P)-dependent oxidoreductase [Aerococcus loyolae]MCY3025283.1 NAD(P)-binding domain-containing protein [Aerococcus loyolae]MCY3027803.1 NAD(P)-binding domain-containing protein [Aerococcus loyolae]MCY3029180.1 NAD(P)-binding domain-containing protein [Aerococcus loyolae]
MDKIIVIGDGLVHTENFVKYVKELWPHKNYQLKKFSWYEDYNKEEFQEKISEIEKNGPEFYDNSEDLLKAIKDCDYLFVHMSPVNEELLSHAENLKLVGVARGGTENINLEYCKGKKIPVIRAVKNAEAVAEFTLGLIIDWTRGISSSMKGIYHGKWKKNFYNDNYRYTLDQYTVGIVGMGNIGIKLAKILLSLGVKILAYHPNLNEAKKKEINLPLNYVSKEELLHNSDIVSLHLRLSPDTEKFINGEAFNLMKDTALLINTARADLIDEGSMKKALEDQLIGGVALDVFWKEPLNSDSYLTKYDNVIVTSHIAGDTDVIDRAPAILLKEVVKWLNNEYTPMLIKDKYMINKK